MDNVTISMVIGAILSAIFEFAPGVRTWWEGLTPAQRGYLNGLFVAVASVGVVLYQCYLSTEGACPTNWLEAILAIVLPLFVGNQVSYNVLGKPFGKRA